MKDFARTLAAKVLSLMLVACLMAISVGSLANARYISPDDWDPTKPGVGTNRYAYSENDPINKSDPNGHIDGVPTVQSPTNPGLGGFLAGFFKGGFTSAGPTTTEMNDTAQKASADAINGAVNTTVNAGLTAMGPEGLLAAKAGTLTAKLAGTFLGFSAKFGKFAKPGVSLVNPKAIRFTQNSIKATFKDGKTVQQMADDLASGALKAEDVPAISVFQKNGSLYSLDNRRLAAFQRAGVDVPVRMASPEEVVNQGWKFTTGNDGLSIVVRGE